MLRALTPVPHHQSSYRHMVNTPPLAKAGHWFGEELRQWRRPSQTSSATPRMMVIDGTACGGGGGGGAPLPSTPPPTSPIAFGGGAGGDWPRLWSTLWGTLTLQWLGHWSCRDLWASKLLLGAGCALGGPVGRHHVRHVREVVRGRWVRGTRACPGALGRGYPCLSLRGRLCLLLISMWRKHRRSWTALDLIRILRPFRPRHHSLEGH